MTTPVIPGIHHITAIAGDPQRNLDFYNHGPRLATRQAHRERVRESGEVFRRMNASVDERIYPRLGHTVTQDEIHAIQEVLRPRHAVRL